MTYLEECSTSEVVVHSPATVNVRFHVIYELQRYKTGVSERVIVTSKKSQLFEVQDDYTATRLELEVHNLI